MNEEASASSFFGRRMGMSLDEIKKRTTPTGKTVGMFNYLKNVETGLAGDMALVVTPATLGSSAAVVNAGGFSREIKVELKNAAGDVHEWFNGTFAIAATEVTVGDGTSAIEGAATTVTLVNGVGTVTIEYIGTWASADTQTLTVTGSTKLGYAITDKTSVDTLIA
jgi:hypothetical protein